MFLFINEHYLKYLYLAITNTWDARFAHYLHVYNETKSYHIFCLLNPLLGLLVIDSLLPAA